MRHNLGVHKLTSAMRLRLRQLYIRWDRMMDSYRDDADTEQDGTQGWLGGPVEALSDATLVAQLFQYRQRFRFFDFLYNSPKMSQYRSRSLVRV